MGSKWAIPEPQQRIEIRQLFDKDISAIVPMLIKHNLCEITCIDSLFPKSQKELPRKAQRHRGTKAHWKDFII